jgi:CheY-like chemotaxis protein
MANHRVLVVDDEENIRFALKRWFEAGGFDVDVAEDGVQAVEACQNHHYDVITMDLEMPRLGGKEAFVQIREIHPEIPVIFLTGYYDRLQDPIFQHAFKVLLKPISLHELEDEVRRAVDGAA